MPDALTPLSPQWWLKRLYTRLVERRDEIDFFNDYYIGDHPLPWLAPQARDEFRRILKMTRTNCMGLVCDSTAERASVEGFRFGSDGTADSETWRIWQGNNLDSDSDMAWLESLICKVSYFHVGVNPADAALPFVWVEHPSQAIVEQPDGSLVVTLHVSNDWALRSWILGFGPLARVLSPPDLATQVADEFERARLLYSLPLGE